jgi:transcriptional regulator with XRE-family HTH domain
MQGLVSEDRLSFAAKVRAARAVLGWSQAELAERAHLTQRSIHRLEQATSDIRRSTSIAIESEFSRAGIVFESAPGGGFKLNVPRAALTHQKK